MQGSPRELLEAHTEASSQSVFVMSICQVGILFCECQKGKKGQNLAYMLVDQLCLILCNPWTAARQPTRLLCPWDFPHPGIKFGPSCTALQADSYQLGYSSNGKESACDAGDQGSVSALRSASGEGNGNPLQYSCLENSMRSLACYNPWGRRVGHNGATHTRYVHVGKMTARIPWLTESRCHFLWWPQLLLRPILTGWVTKEITAQRALPFLETLLICI